MTAREVHQLQLALRDAPENEALALQVREAQSAVGGVVYRIPAGNAESLREKLDKLAKRAAKLKAGKVSYRVDNEVEVVERTIDPMIAAVELGYVPPAKSKYYYFVLDAETVVLEGWTFVATLTVEPGGVMISKTPAADALNLQSFAKVETATRCDHCNLDRDRAKTYLVSRAGGEIKQVGANCLRDFLGADPHDIARWLTYISDATEALSEEESYGPRAKQQVGTEEFLAHVAGCLRTVGWVAASDYNPNHPATKAQALQNWEDYGKTWDGKPLYFELVPADGERAAEALAWGREHFARLVDEGKASDFDHNMLVACAGDFAPSRGLGVLAYLPVAHTRFLEREVERAERAKDDAASEHVGQPKDRLELTLTVASVFEHPGDYGTTFITKLKDADGNVFKWFGSYSLEVGATVTGKWTVKGHGEYKGVKETTINRPKLAEEATA